MISKSSLAIELSRLNVFENPKAIEEQYPTDSEIAAEVLWHAFMKGWIKDKIVADFGAGTGILGIGALILGAKKCFFVEKDKNVVEILKRNIERRDLMDKSNLIEGDIKDFKEKVELVVENPPFGTRKKGSDVSFLEKAFRVSKRVISFHKSSTRDYIISFGRKCGFESIDEINFFIPLKNTMKFHKKREVKIEVSCFFFESN
ncbi:MAG: putative methylase [Candidatus Woesearchaeota archaeon]|nr:putative methylase [Candidatus Woesearchaeota archaeon]